MLHHDNNSIKAILAIRHWVPADYKGNRGMSGLEAGEDDETACSGR